MGWLINREPPGLGVFRRSPGDVNRLTNIVRLGLHTFPFIIDNVTKSDYLEGNYRVSIVHAGECKMVTSACEQDQDGTS